MTAAKQEGVTLTFEQFEELSSKFAVPEQDFKEYHDILQEYKMTLGPIDMVEPIITRSQNVYARINILTILKEILSRVWDIITVEKRSSLKKFFFDAVSTTMYGPDNDKESSFEIICLIEILKKEWPNNWPEFSRLLIQNAKMQGGAPINCTRLFEFLTQDIKETINSGIPIMRHRELESALMKDAPMIISFISDILNETTDEDLIIAGLDCLARMIKYTNPLVVTNQIFIESIKNLFTNDNFKLAILNCLSVIPKTKYQDLSLPKIVEGSFAFQYELLSSWIDENFDFHNLCQMAPDLANKMAQCLIEYLRYDQYRILLFIAYNPSPFVPVIHWLLHLFELSFSPTYDICIEFWEEITQQMIRDSSEIRLSKHYIHTLIKITVSKMIPPPAFPFMHEDTEETIYNVTSQLIHNLTKIDPEYITQGVVGGILSTSGENLFCKCFAFGAMSVALPEQLKLKSANDAIMYLLQKSEERQDFAIGLLIICSEYVQYLKTNLTVLSQVLKHMIEWALGSTSLEFQMFCIQQFDKVCNFIPQQSLNSGGREILSSCEEIANQLNPECHPSFFRALAALIHTAGPTEKQNLVNSGLGYPLNRWNEVMQQLDTVDVSIFRLSITSLTEIVSSNDEDMQEIIKNIVSSAMTVFHAIPADDVPRNRAMRDAIFELFEKVSARSEVQLAGDVVSCIVQDYTESHIQFRYPQALKCFAQFIRRENVDTDLSLALCANVITSTAESIIDSGEECPDVEISVFELIQAAVACASSLESFDVGLCAPLESVVEWGLSRTNDQTVASALSTVTLIVESSNNLFSMTFLEQFFLSLCGAIIEGMMMPVNNMQLFTMFTRTIHSMMELQCRTGCESEELITALSERIGMITEGLDPQIIYDFASAIVNDFVDTEKLQTHLAELVNELRVAVFRNQQQREQYGLEGGFLLSAPFLVSLGSMPEIPEF